MARLLPLAWRAWLAGALYAAPAWAQAAPPGTMFGPAINQAAQQFGNDLARSATQLGNSAGRAADAFTRALNQPYNVTIPTQSYPAYRPYVSPMTAPVQPPPKFKIPREVRKQIREQARAQARDQANQPAVRWRGLPPEVIAQLDEDQRGLMDAAQDKALDAPLGEELFWTFAGSSGFVRVVSEDRFGSFACRNFLHAITVAGQERQGALTACRDTDGTWTQSF